MYMHDLWEQHFSALKCIVWYIWGANDHKLQIHISSTTSITTYSEVDWGGCASTRRSTFSWCDFLGDNLIPWSSKRQSIDSRSNVEAEYRGVANVVVETSWICNMLIELHCPTTNATLIYFNNVSAMYMSSNPVQHKHTKHIQIDTYFVRDKVALDHISVFHVSSII